MGLSREASGFLREGSTVLPEGWMNTIALLDGQPDVDPMGCARRLCTLSAQTTGMTGAALAVSSNGHRSTVCATDAVSERLEELQLTFSEGPDVDSLRDGWAVLVSDLDDASVARWPWFAPAALDMGAHAVFVLPLRVGAIRLGVLSLYRTSVGGITRVQNTNARELAEAAALLLTIDSSEHTAAAFIWALGDESRFRAAVHQAVGVLMVQLDVEARDAFARLCAYAYVVDTPVGEISDQIVAKRLHLPSDTK